MPRKTETSAKINISIGRKIKECRLLNGLSRKQLSERLGVSGQQLQKYENGSNCIAPERLISLTVVFGKNIQFFFDGIYSPPEDKNERLSLELQREFTKLKSRSVKDAFVLLLRNFNRVAD